MNLIEIGSAVWNETITGVNEPLELASTSPHDVVTLQFTSGSTGSAKAVPVTDQMQNQRFMSGGIFSVAFAFQPPGYSTQRHSFYRIISGGGRLVLHSGDMATFWREVAAASVTSFGAPPRIYSYLHSLFEQRAVVIGHAAAAAECKAVLAERCSTVHVGGAITPVELLIWMRKIWAEKVQDGYGCTECGSIAKNGIVDHHVRVIVEPELQPLKSSEATDDGSVVGILWVHTRNCATRYVDTSCSDEFRKINETSLTGEPYSVYYNTGDRVRFWPSCNRLQVIGRAKSKLRLSNATFVDADAVQSAISMSAKGYYDVGNVLICCRSSSDIIVAVVQIRHTIEMSSTLKQEILEEMQSSCKSKSIPSSCIPHRVVIDAGPWTVGTGCITASGKLQRLGIETRVAKELDELFEASQRNLELLSSTEDLRHGTLLTLSSFNSLVHQYIPGGILVDHELPLAQNGCDSIVIAQLAARLSKFQTKVPVSTSILHSRSIVGLASLFVGEIHSSDFGSAGTKTLLAVAEDDTEIPEDLLAPMDSSAAGLLKNGIFVTGASGFLGIHILSKIMQQAQCLNAFCLVRGSSEQEALSRLKRQAADANLELCWNRVSVVVGDLSLPLFGLGPAEFASLASKVDMVVHNGALVHWLKDYNNMRQSNVIGTHTCARLAHMASARAFTFVSSSSSITSAEKKSSGRPGSALLPLTAVGKMTGYGATKRVSEVFLCKFAAQHPGMALCILRPATIISSPFPPSYNMHDAFSRYIQACFLLRAVPIDNAIRLNFVPVDLVAKVAVESVIHGNSGGCSLINILCGSGLSLSEVSLCIRSACSIDIQSVPVADWLQLLNSDCPAPLQPLHYIFQRGSFPWSSAYDSEVPDDTVVSQGLSEKAVESSARWVAFNMLLK